MSDDSRKTVRYDRNGSNAAGSGDQAPEATKVYERKGKLGQRVSDAAIGAARQKSSEQELTRPAGLKVGPGDSEEPALVMGWLVVETGVGRGQSFPLFSKRNSVGRAPDQDVSLVFSAGEDNQISRTAHCFIGFEPKKNVFIAEKGSGSNYAYVNGDTLLSDQILQPYDRIEIGNTTLVVVPFCGEHFEWQSTSSS
jgi:hypothetical protein